MKPEQWKEIKFFKSSENWGDPSEMSIHLLRVLDTVRSLCKHPFVIHCGYANGVGHSDASYHYIGHAIDFHMTGIEYWDSLHLLQQVLVDMKISNRVGLGTYPHWLPGTQGFHLDDRGWQCEDRPPEQGIFWVRLDKPAVGFKTDYYYNATADRVINLLKKNR